MNCFVTDATESGEYPDYPILGKAHLCHTIIWLT